MKQTISTLEESLFPVVKVPAPHPFYAEEGWETQPTGYQYIMRADTNEIISCMSDEYMLVPNQRLIDSAMPAIEKFGGKLVSVNVFANARTSYKFQFPQDVGIQEDVVHPQVIIRNSYDGTVGVHIIAGAFRMVCTNGLVVGTIIRKINNKHLVHNKNIAVLEENIKLTIQKLEGLMSGVINMLVSAEPVEAQHISKLLELFPDRVAPYVVQRLVAEKPKNYWDLLNVATWTATHVMKRDAESTHKFESSLFDTVRKMAGITGRA